MRIAAVPAQTVAKCSPNRRNPEGTDEGLAALRKVRSSYNSAVLILHGHSSNPVVKQASEVLDQSGLSYMTKPPTAEHPSGKAAAVDSSSVRVSWGSDSVSNFSRQELVEFLWAHGAKFEDS
jgi:hypothetical protein